LVDREISNPKEFKAEAAAPAEKKEKPISQIANDLGVNESVLCRWMQQAREAAQGGLPTVTKLSRKQEWG
jgi:transposase-like protein